MTPPLASLTRFVVVPILITWIAVIGGCASGHSSASTDAAVIDGRSLVIVRGDTGARVTWEELISSSTAADAVLIGEEHGHPAGQAFQSAVFADILARSPAAAGALEFFERDEQDALDDYLTEVTDEEVFRTKTRRSASNYPFGHRAMVEACRAAKRPVIAANAPRRYVRLARTEGFDRLRALTPEQQRLFTIPTVLLEPGTRYRDDFTRVMAGRGNDKEGDDAIDPATRPMPVLTDQERVGIEAGFRSQSVWDATMADSVGRAVAAEKRPVVLIVGRFHVDFGAVGGGGLYQALARGGQSVPAILPERIVNISLVSSWSETLRAADRDRATFIVYTGPAPAGP